MVTGNISQFDMDTSHIKLLRLTCNAFLFLCAKIAFWWSGDFSDCLVTSKNLSLRVDYNKDRSVSAKEMQRWIMEKTEEHFQEAQMENKNSFAAVDPDGDGERI